MNDLQIEYFLSAARNLSFSRAAQELYVSQPAVSRQIQSLERELGAPLFRRFNKGIALTANGEMFYDFFERYQTELYDLKLRAKLLLENKKKIIRLGVLNNWNIADIMLPILEKFGERYPDIKIEINSYEPHGSLLALQSGKEDVILTIEPQILNIEGIRYESVAKLQRVLLYRNTDMACRGKEHPTPYDFKEEEFLTVSSEAYDYVTELIRGICKPYGFTPKVQPVHSTDAMIMGVQCGLGVAVTDIWSRALDNPGFSWLFLNSGHVLSMVWKNEEGDPILYDFVELLRSVIRKNVKDNLL